MMEIAHWNAIRYTALILPQQARHKQITGFLGWNLTDKQIEKLPKMRENALWNYIQRPSAYRKG